MEADPTLYEPLVNLGGVLLNLGSLGEACRYNSEAVRRRPNDALAQSQLGLNYLLLNQLEQAEQHLLRACQLDPAHFSHPQLHLAEVYVRRKEFRQAAEQLDDFIHRHPDWPTATKIKETVEQWRR
jgi:tetratricopeptide (TPR) repeat protein